MLHIDHTKIPGYFEKWPLQGNGELNEITKFIGFSVLTIDLRKVTEANINEWLYRLDVYYDLYGQMPTGGDERKVTREELVGHIGLQVNGDESSREAFDDKIAELRYTREHNCPRPVYVHIRFEDVRPGKVSDIYQHVFKKDGQETRRVEVYPDGRHLWVEDGYFGEGTGNVEREDTQYPGLEILNARPGQRAWTISDELFEEKWETATDERCGWIERLGSGDGEADYCPDKQTPGAAYCAKHHETARRLFPRLFPTE